MLISGCQPQTSFNPRAHGRRDPELGGANRYIRVSIHAPTGGATISQDYVDELVEFQSTRPREARRGHLRNKAAVGGFNPRAHGRRDWMWYGTNGNKRFQSTRPREARLTVALR